MNETSFESTNYESEFSQKSFGSKALSKTQISDNYISQFSIDWRRLHYDYKSTKEESFYKDHIDLSHLSLFYWDDYSFEPSFRYLTQDQKTIFAALAQKKWNHSLAYLHYTQAYKIPNFSDLYDEASYYQPNPDLKPEHSDQWELGHIWQNSNLEIKNSLYYIEYKDLIQRKSLGTNLSTKENIAQAKAHGWEFSARKSFMFWAVEYSHNIMNAYDQTQALAMSPHQQHSFSLSHYWAFLEFVVAANYISAAKDLNFTTGKLQDLPEFLAYDFSIKTYKTNGFDLSLGVENFNNAARVYSLDYPEYQRNYFIKYSQYF